MSEAAKNLKWWRENTLFMEEGGHIKQTDLIKKLAEMGYERTKGNILPGQFAVLGEIVKIFPVNELKALTVAFSGNTIEELEYSQKDTVSEEKREKIFAPEVKRSELTEIRFLRPGDYVVHSDHGIGIFSGFQIIGEQKYYVLNYAAPKGERAKPDQLLVPEGLEEKLTPYFGFAHPQVHRLGSQSWEKIKRRVNEEVINMAKELVELYAKREIAKRPPYEKDDRLQKEFEHLFEFIETDDQLKAVEDIKKDLESNRPMDRLIVGDVGFGKTEVAMRAAFKVASHGKQVAFLCPTTILADQHYKNFKKRMEKFPLEIALISRFEQKKEQKETAEKLKSGRIDIIIGTHRLLSRDIEFKNLGLLIIDEEQRFGVKQKEKLKHFHTDVDVLSLSATPIPRSLYMAMSNIRDMSQIYTPPPNRQPVETLIMPYDKNVLKENIKKGTEKGGQIYFLHNRIQTIEKTFSEIRKLAPKIKVRVAHSRIPEQSLRKIMNDFSEKKFDMLLATTIIENGLDFPNVNMLIVENAARLGLSQAYQIRGRIGRSERKAKAIFFYTQRNLTEKAALRLEALKEAEALGSGYFIAKKDLEIRGAGNILGKEQSGNINKVGFNIYCQMLAEATEQLKEKN
jgi:transcription-repair coupling factor (superfamily II helicase)